MRDNSVIIGEIILSLHASQNFGDFTNFNEMKRHRGLKRYYRNLSHQNDFDKMIRLNFNNSDIWFDNWHTHFDWNGFGNTSFKKRKPHLDKLFRHFELLANMTNDIKVEFQLYAMLFDFDSGSDALFLHTKNPNGSRFPLYFEDLEEISTLQNKRLNEYINSLNGYTVVYGKTDEAFCLLYKEGIGIGIK